MFMGDVGSVSLGFVLASVALWIMSLGGWELIVPLGLLHANFVLDSGITLLRRVLRGERLNQAHREHFYQRLVRAGKSHYFVTSAEMALQAVVVGLLVLFIKSGTAERWYIAITIVTVWLAFFRYAEVCFCGSQRHAER
jgi:UDP-N-acetylmuramyl pentapeptide phosphotransferase/UDP-N-acetylglucosamine-1-phosphate transferase